MKPMLAAPVRWLTRLPLLHSLRFRLTLLVLIGALPALGLLFLTASQQRNDALAEGQETAVRLVRLASADQRRVFDQAQQLLTTVARLPEVREDDAANCAELIGELLLINPGITNIGVVNRDGSVFCAREGEDLRISLSDHAFIAEAFEADDIVVGTYQLGPLADEPTVAYAVPVMSGAGGPERIVFSSLDLSALDTFANIANLPDGTAFRVFDRSGVLLFNWPQEPEAIGRSHADEPVVESMIADPSGISVRTLDDPDAIYAGETIHVRAGDGGVVSAGFITVAVPKAAVIARADDTFQENVSRLGLAALVAVALAWVGADLFMSRDSETRKSLVADLYRVYETGDLRRLDDIIDVDVVDRSPAPGQVQGLSGYKQLMGRFRAAFPNGKIIPDDLLADGDTVVARVTLTGTHVGEFFGLPASGKPVVAKGVETFRFANGVIVEMWSLFTPLVVVRRPMEETAAAPAAAEPAPAPRKRPGRLRRLAISLRRRLMR
jgi:predicted ester cyclase